MRRTIFVEGTPDDTNGNLRAGFSQLFAQRLAGKMPVFILGGGKNQCVNKFRAFVRQHDEAYLLVDLDKAPSYRDQEAQDLDIVDSRESVYFMIQAMEAWFLSQPNILDIYYSAQLAGKIKGDVKDINKPCDRLTDLVKKHTVKGVYHKVTDGAKLLALLSIEKLAEDFEDVRKLLEKMQ